MFTTEDLQNSQIISSLDLVYVLLYQTTTKIVYRTSIQENKNNILESIVQQIKPFQNSFIKSINLFSLNFFTPKLSQITYKTPIQLNSAMSTSSINFSNSDNNISTKTCINFYCTALASDSKNSAIRQSGFYRILLQIQEPLYILFRPKVTFQFFLNEVEIKKANIVTIYKHTGTFGTFEKTTDFKSQFESSFSNTGDFMVQNDFDSLNEKNDIFYSIGIYEY